MKKKWFVQQTYNVARSTFVRSSVRMFDLPRLVATMTPQTNTQVSWVK